MSAMSAWILFRLTLLLGSTGVTKCQLTIDEIESSESQLKHRDVINLLLESRQSNNQLRQMVENVELRLEIALTGVTQLLQQMSANNTSHVEARLDTFKLSLENLGTGVGQLMQQTQQSLLLVNGIPGVEARLKTLEIRLENLGTELGLLMQHTLHCPCSCSNNNTTTDHEFPLYITTAETGLTQSTLQPSTNLMSTMLYCRLISY